MRTLSLILAAMVVWLMLGPRSDAGILGLWEADLSGFAAGSRRGAPECQQLVA